MTITPFYQDLAQIYVQSGPKYISQLENGWIMAIRRKWINYTVYPPNHEPGKVCWDYRTVVKARLAAKNLGVGSRLRRNINLRNKGEPDADWWVDRVWEWTGTQSVDITRDPSKGLP